MLFVPRRLLRKWKEPNLQTEISRGGNQGPKRKKNYRQKTGTWFASPGMQKINTGYARRHHCIDRAVRRRRRRLNVLHAVWPNSR